MRINSTKRLKMEWKRENVKEKERVRERISVLGEPQDNSWKWEGDARLSLFFKSSSFSHSFVHTIYLKFCIIGLQGIKYIMLNFRKILSLR